MEEVGRRKYLSARWKGTPGFPGEEPWIPAGTVGTPGFSSAQWVILDPRRGSRNTLLITFQLLSRSTLCDPLCRPDSRVPPQGIQEYPSTVKNAKRYHVKRKDEFALLCMAISNSDRRNLWWDISQAPTTHDSMAWGMTVMGQRVARGDLPEPFFLSDDAAFSLSNSMITPSGLPQHDDYDYHQSSNGMPVECAFGILVRRWGLLWRPLEVKFENRAQLLGALIRLNNFCIDEAVTVDVNINSAMSEIQPGRWAQTPRFDDDGRPFDFLDIDRGNVPRARDRRQARCSRRDELVRIVAESTLQRPARRVAHTR